MLRSRASWFFASSILIGCGGPGQAPETARPTAAAVADAGKDPASVARTFVEQLSRHEWQLASLSLDKSLTATKSGAGGPAKTLETFWAAVEQGTPLTGIEGVATGRRGPFDVVLLVCRFGEKLRVVRLSLTAEERVAGLFQGSAQDLAAPDARTFVEALAAHEVPAAHGMLAPALRAKVTERELGGMWSALEQELGAFVAIDRVDVTTPAETRATVTVRFAKGARAIVVGFGETADVIGVKVAPAAPSWDPPPYVKPAAFTEKPVAIGKPELPGVLAMPNGASGAVPGVVLVHRDGPQDEDETVAAIRPFKDIAGGLASRGIAVLRYKKRALGEIKGEATEKQEVIEPAVAAVEALKATPGIDPARIFVVGHGRGGALAPIIARDAKAKGAALLAAPTRTLPESLAEQLAYLSSLDPSNADLKAQVEGWKKLRQKVEDKSLDRSATVPLPSGGQLPAAYFIVGRELAPVQAAAAFAGPLFVAHGARDFQVAPAQLDEWKKALAKAPKATFKSYPTLGHLFTPSTGPKPAPADYDGPLHVDAQVVADLAAWLERP